MELTNEFEVAVPVAEAWAVLTDVELIAPCLPGAELREVEGDEYRGIVKVKVGPITASYKGAARFSELDEVGHRAVLKAEGRETRGQGNATAVITATLSPSDRGTKVAVGTDLAITGKVAQFGRGVLADVSAKLLDQFVANLEATVLSPGAALEAAAGAAAASESAATNGEAPAKPARAARKTTAPKAATRAPKAPARGPVPAGAPDPATEADEEFAHLGADAAAGDVDAAAEFAKLGSEAAAAEGAPTGASTTHVAPSPPAGVRKIDSAPAEPVNLVDVAGGSVARRLAPYMTVAGVLLIIRIVVYSIRRRRK
jgi:carbon monoxide dehydrogenase subunit G